MVINLGVFLENVKLPDGFRFKDYADAEFSGRLQEVDRYEYLKSFVFSVERVSDRSFVQIEGSALKDHPNMDIHLETLVKEVNAAIKILSDSQPGVRLVPRAENAMASS